MTEEELLAPISVYQASFASTWAGDAPLRSVRFVVLDCESTGLDPKRDSIVSIGAVAVSEAQIILADGFETLLKVSHNTAATLIHGITREETFNALDEREAMQGFLDYLRDGVHGGSPHQSRLGHAQCRLRTPLRCPAAEPPP